MASLTTTPVTTPSRDRGTVDSFERYNAPSPGSYGLLRKDCKGRHDDRMSANTMKEGTLLMLAKVELADGEPHVYTFAKNPGIARNEACETRVLPTPDAPRAPVSQADQKWRCSWLSATINR